MDDVLETMDVLLSSSFNFLQDKVLQETETDNQERRPTQTEPEQAIQTEPEQDEANEDENGQQPRSLTLEEKWTISKTFASLISSNETVTLKRIRKKMQKNDMLKVLLNIQGMDRKVADRIRTCQARSVRAIEEQKEERTQKKKTPLLFRMKKRRTKRWRPEQ